MNQGGGLQSVVSTLAIHFGRGEIAQFLINKRQQLVGGFAVAILNILQNTGHLAHFGARN
jgi:hypothetical protein